MEHLQLAELPRHCFLLVPSRFPQVAHQARTLAGGHLQPGDGVLAQRAAEEQALCDFPGRGRVRALGCISSQSQTSILGLSTVQMEGSCVKASPLPPPGWTTAARPESSSSSCPRSFSIHTTGSLSTRPTTPTRSRSAPCQRLWRTIWNGEEQVSQQYTDQ